VRRALALAALLLPASAGLDATTVAARVPPAAPTSRALLTGQFLLAGRVTVAHNIKGERVGDRALRTWTFTPRCQTGACRAVRLVRRRGAKLSDTVILHLLGPGEYGGTGLFYAPLRCAGHTYPRGESVPFTIGLHVTAAALILGLDVATRITATYESRARTNLTRCVHVPGHDAAAYHGHLILPASGGAGAVSDRSPAGN
jgi:hypothetical protein